MRSVVFVLFIFSLSALAQEKTSNFDLRAMREIFSISDISKKEQRVYKLMTSTGGVFTMILTENGEQKDQWKVDTGDAQLLDDRFADEFINLKYIMPPSKVNKCEKSYLLSLRGERQNICPKESDKVNKVKDLLVFLNKKLKQ